MKITKLSLLSLFFMLLMLPACKEPVIIIPEKSMADLIVPDGFDYGMTKPVRIAIQLPSTISYSDINRIIEIWDENSAGQPGNLVKKGASDHDGYFETTINVTSSTRKIFSNCFAGWRAVSFLPPEMKSADTVFVVEYDSGYGFKAPDPKQVILNIPGNGVPSNPNNIGSTLENQVKNGNFSDHNFGTMETWSDPLGTDSLWYATDAAKTHGSIISEEGNSFARINTLQHSAGGFTQLVQATEGQIVTFSGDARGFDSQQDIYLFLIPRKENGEYIELISYNIVNPGTIWTTGTVAGTMPPGTATCQILFYKRSTGFVDFDNAVVHVYDLHGDSDFDGMLDFEDQYPDNPALAFDDAYPASGKFASFVFEDSWPVHNDYDFNDLVVDYRITRISNPRNQVAEIRLTTQVRAIGSGLASGFGFQMYVAPDLVSGIVSDFEFSDTNISLNPNGTEASQKWATFILYGDANKAFNFPQEGSPTVNTTLGYYFVVPRQYHYHIYLNAPVDANSIDNNQFNPFIFRTADRSLEVHLPGFPPTDLFNTALMGTGDDASNASSHSFFITKNGVPWALNIPVQFDYPIENNDLLKGHLYFADWASSGGQLYPDWYLDKQNYRNWNSIYRW